MANQSFFFCLNSGALSMAHLTTSAMAKVCAANKNNCWLSSVHVRADITKPGNFSHPLSTKVICRLAYLSTVQYSADVGLNVPAIDSSVKQPCHCGMGQCSHSLWGHCRKELGKHILRGCILGTQNRAQSNLWLTKNCSTTLIKIILN